MADYEVLATADQFNQKAGSCIQERDLENESEKEKLLELERSKKPALLHAALKRISVPENKVFGSSSKAPDHEAVNEQAASYIHEIVRENKDEREKLLELELSEKTELLHAALKLLSVTENNEFGNSGKAADNDVAQVKEQALENQINKESLLEVQRTKQEELFHAALYGSDSECVGFFAGAALFEQPIQDMTHWTQVDEYGDTLLHIVSSRFLPRSTMFLIDTAHVGRTLLFARNADGRNPFEELRFKLDEDRIKSESFFGYSKPATECLAALVMGLCSRRQLSIQHWRRLKYGCSCKECRAGYMSPRMMVALRFQAIIIGGLLSDRVMIPNRWYKRNERFFVHVSPDLQDHLATSVVCRTGFIQIFYYVDKCLTSNIVPTTPAVLHQKRIEGHFANAWLDLGGPLDGKIEPVRRIIFDLAAQEHASGNVNMARELGESLSDLPRCRNDYEFEFVANTCALRKMQQ
jgi:hypothetical protein